MKSFIYKIIIASIAVILVFKLTIGKEINQINQKINYFSTSDGRKSIINSLKKEFVGGCDIVKEMFEKGELKKLLQSKDII